MVGVFIYGVLDHSLFVTATVATVAVPLCAAVFLIVLLSLNTLG